MKNMIYESFSMRIHDDKRVVDDENSWAIRANRDALEHFWVGDVSNPMPEPKTSYEDIQGVNGAYDATEEAERVFYNRKTVTVTLQGEAAFEWMDEVEDALRDYHGRVCDFSFDEADRVKWYYTGRLSVDSNRFRNRFTLTFDAEPLMTSTETVVKRIPVCERLDRTGFGWTVDTALYGSVLRSDASFAETIVLGVSDPGTVVQLIRNANALDVFTMAVVSAVGGDVTFHNYLEESGTIEDSKTRGVADSDGKLRIRVTVDGTHYEWMTVNGVDEYIPVCNIKYRLVQFPAGTDYYNLGENFSHEFPSNVLIRPELAAHADSGSVIIDGSEINLMYGGDVIETPPDAVIPGYRADFSGATTTSVFAVIANTGSTDPEYVMMTFHPKAVG